jgi:hypothetical protein
VLLLRQLHEALQARVGLHLLTLRRELLGPGFVFVTNPLRLASTPVFAQDRDWPVEQEP